ncbi:MAG: hypothetical protein HYX52_03910 [Chloroflexi bacterium]|nr:hypothetical protein [Chloroflexota bacterium]
MMSQTGGMDTEALIQRVRRLLMLDTTVFDEVRQDAGSTAPALIVAAVAILLSGLGGWLWWALNGVGGISDIPGSGKILLQSAIIGSIIAFAIWFVWAGLVYVMLNQVFRARADVQELIRVMGFGTAPLGLGILLVIAVPGIDFGIGLAVMALLFGTTTVAIQTATDAPAGRVLIANFVGFAVWAIVLSLLVSSTSVFAPGFFEFHLPVKSFQDAF